MVEVVASKENGIKRDVLFQADGGAGGGEGGAPDEWSMVSGLRWRLTDGVFLKFDNSLGISSKATDWEPQIGWFFSFPVVHHTVHVKMES